VLLLASCRPRGEFSDQVQLVFNPDTVEPTTSFELRFNEEVVSAETVGQPASQSPLVISPPLKGRFVWLSRRSGIFTPEEPPELGATYSLRLREGLRNAAQQPVRARLERRFQTPLLELTASHPFDLGSTNANAAPEIRLDFNAKVRPQDAARHLVFRGRNTGPVPATVAQATSRDRVSFRGGFAWPPPPPTPTWAERFRTKAAAPTGPGLAPLLELPPSVGPADEEAPITTYLNSLLVRPEKPLPPGEEWELQIRKGLPSPETKATLGRETVVPIGRVLPLTLVAGRTDNTLRFGKIIYLDFSKAILPDITNQFHRWISIAPKPEDFLVRHSENTLEFHGAFQLSNRYRVSLQPGLPAADGLKLEQGCAQHYEFTPLQPRVCFPTFSSDQQADGKREFPILAVNLAQIELRAKLLDRHTLIHALRGCQEYFGNSRRWFGPQEQAEPVDYNLVPGRTVFTKAIQFSNVTDVAEQVALKWDELLGGRKTGAVFLNAERGPDLFKSAPRLGAQALVQLTDLGLVWRQSPDNTLVYVFSHASGLPVAHALVRLMTDENEALAEQMTDTQGLALLGAQPKAGWVMAEKGDDLHAVEFDKRRLPLYRFGLRDAWWHDEVTNHLKVLLFSERQVYRPGETLRLKAIARDRQGGDLWAPAGLKGTLRGIDSKGLGFFETNVVLSAVGSFDQPVPLPPSPLGSYELRLSLGGLEFWHYFEVQEYQPSPFEVSLDAEPAYAAGHQIKLSLAARHHFGGALAKAKVAWFLQASDTGFSPEGFEEFVFCKASDDRLPDRQDSHYSDQGEAEYTCSAGLVITPRLRLNLAAPQPRHVSFSAEVTDLSQQTVSCATDFTAHSSDFYLGLKRVGQTVPSGTSVRPELIAVDWQGQPVQTPVKAKVTLYRVDWKTVRVEQAGGTLAYQNEPDLKELMAREVVALPLRQTNEGWEMEPGASSVPALALDQAGDYLIEAKATDAAGREVITNMRIGVAGDEEVAWDYANEVEVELTPDKELYESGDTATVLLKTPIEGTALVTMERETVLRSFVTNLTGNAAALFIPIKETDAPNLYVSVTLVRGAKDSPKQVKAPEHRVAYCQLRVHNPARRLQVLVEPAAADYRPRENVQVTITVKDWQDRPAPGVEVVFYAVDEGILSLTAYQAPSPYEFFHEPRSQAVRGGLSLHTLFPEDPAQVRFNNKGYLVGGGGGEAPRNNFLACAAWRPALTTDAAGRVVVDFPAPDSLTRYRLMAVVHSARHEFGAAASAIQINKPLMLEPALPRFANIGDWVFARGVLHNRTDSPGEVELSLTLDDKARLRQSPLGADAPDYPTGASLTNRVEVPASGSVAVDIPVEFVEPGLAAWVWRATLVKADRTNGLGPLSAGSAAQSTPTASLAARQVLYEDSVCSTFQVGYPVPLLRNVYVAEFAETEKNLLAGVSPQLLEGQGTLTVRVSRSRLSELAEALLQLLHYPYGCVEQTGSSLLPWLVLRDSPALQLLTGRSRTEMDNAIRAGVGRLFSMQTSSGGLAYWPGEDQPTPWASAYGAVVLGAARNHGIQIPEQSYERLLVYLSGQLRNSGQLQHDSQLADKCQALYALALAKRPEPSYHEVLYKQRAALSTQSRAVLALAILEAQGDRTLASELLQYSPPAASRLDELAFASPATEAATRLLAWSRLQPHDPTTSRLAGELMEQMKDGHWGTTQGNAWALLALADYSASTDQQKAASPISLVCGAKSESFELTDTSPLQERIFPLQQLARRAGLAVGNPGRARLFSQVVLEARPRLLKLPQLDRGFSIARVYARLDDHNQPQEARNLRVGDRILVTLTLEARRPANYLVVDDPLPSLFEAVNPAFVTQQTAAQALASDWLSDHHELRTDRAVFFRNRAGAGRYQIRYLARVRAAGTATAPSTKVEEMYRPERHGLAETLTITALPLN
jgi:uncharacterized protein YfaS (alpha-2-macroglobulin family)